MSETTANPADKRGNVQIINLERFKNTVLFSICIRRFGNSARIKDMNALEQYIAESKQTTTDEDTEKNGAGPAVFIASDRVKSSKALIRSPRLDRLNKAMNALKGRVETMSIPSYFRPGMFVSKQSNVLAVEQALKDGWAAIEARELNDFINGYPADVESAKTTPVKKGGLGPLFAEKDYPSGDELRKMFSVEWFWMALSVPENIPEALREEANEKFKRRMEDAASQIEQALRSELLELVAHAEERLTPVPGDKPRVFRDSAISNILDFIKTFDSRDVFSDQRLQPIVDQARALMLDDKGNSKMDAQKLRDFPTVRENTRQKFAEIRKQLDALVEESGRVLDLSE